MAKAGAISLWQSRGGGLYGLGYVLTFVALEVLEIPEFFQDLFYLFAGEGTLPGALFAMAVEFFVDTGLNMLSAFIWPALLIEQLGGFGVFIVAFGFATFNRLWRPLVERVIPELKAASAEEVVPDECAAAESIAASSEPADQKPVPER